MTLVLLAAVIAGTQRIGFSQGNPGDPLFCQPNEGNAFLIVNGGGGIFTVDPDCYNNNINNDTTTTITTSQGGTLTLTRAPNGGNYTYTPPTPGFTGIDTFSINVTTVWNSAGGVGSSGGVARPGGPATINVILNVIPATTTLASSGGPTTLPIPPGSITGCGAQGNAGQGPPPGAISGCITQIQQGFGAVNPSHGTVARGGPGNNTLIYTPNAGYSGPDSFTYQAFGVNTDGTNALSSGNVTVNVTVNPQADLSITKTAPLPLVGGQNVTYTITVTNNGPGPAAAVTVTDPTPSFFTFVSNTGGCTTAFPCSLGTVNPNQTVTIQATYTVPANFQGSTNTATVSSTTPDPNMANNSVTFANSAPTTPVPSTIWLVCLGLGVVTLWRKARPTGSAS